MNLHLPLLLERGPIQDILLIFVFEVGIVPRFAYFLVIDMTEVYKKNFVRSSLNPIL